jgi:hypothetical protein
MTSVAAVPCPPSSLFNQLANLRIGNKDADELRKSPSQEIKDDAAYTGKTADEIIGVYVNCIAQNPVPSAPPMEAGRKRSRKHRNRRGARSKSKCSRRNSRSKSKRSRRNSRSKTGSGINIHSYGLPEDKITAALKIHPADHKKALIWLFENNSDILEKLSGSTKTDILTDLMSN